MRFFGIVLVITIFVSEQVAFSKEGFLRRRTLLEDSDVGDVYQVSVGSPKVSRSGIVLKSKMIAIPGWYKTAQIDGTNLDYGETKGGFSYFTYKNGKTPFGNYYTGYIEGDCSIIGFKNTIHVEVLYVTDAGIRAKAIKGDICDTELGAALMCKNLLAGIVRERDVSQTTKQETAKQETVKQETVKQETAKPEIAKHETAKHETAKHEGTTKKGSTVQSTRRSSKIHSGTEKSRGADPTSQKGLRVKRGDTQKGDSCSTEVWVSPIKDIDAANQATEVEKQPEPRKRPGTRNDTGAEPKGKFENAAKNLATPPLDTDLAARDSDMGAEDSGAGSVKVHILLTIIALSMLFI